MRATRELRDRFARAIPSGTFSLSGVPGLLRGDLLPERFGHVFNNDHGLKRILFDIDGVSDFVLDGCGETLAFCGEVLPIRVGRSRNITIRDLVIDWRRPFCSEATVTGSEPGMLEFEADPASNPLRSDRGRLIAFDREGWQTDALWNLLPFDSARGEVSSSRENWHLSRWHRASDLGGGRFRLEADFLESYPAGTPIVMMHGNRAAPGIWIEESENVRLENVTIYHAPVMAVVGQLSRDVSLDRVRVMPAAGRLFSSWVDAFHFVDCDGTTRVDGCEARGQFDDAVNIHGNFSKVVEASGRRLRLQTIHPQRFGRNAATRGTGLAVYLRDTMERILVTRVEESTPINREFCDVVLEDSVPVRGGSLIVSRHNPEHNAVVIRGCTFGANRGRGCLVNIEHPAVIEGCRFHVSGHAIESVPDANYWWEGPPVIDLTIRGNNFENCGFGPCGTSLIKAGPEFPDGSDPRSGALRDAAGPGSMATDRQPVLGSLTIAGNTISHTAGDIFDISHVSSLEISGNRIQGREGAVDVKRAG